MMSSTGGTVWVAAALVGDVEVVPRHGGDDRLAHDSAVSCLRVARAARSRGGAGILDAGPLGPEQRAAIDAAGRERGR